MRLHDELRKDWTQWSERLDGEAAEPQKKAVRGQRPQLDRPHPDLPRDYYRGKLRALRERKVREGSEFSRVQSAPTPSRSSHDPLGYTPARYAPSCLHLARHIVLTR